MAKLSSLASRSTTKERLTDSFRASVMWRRHENDPSGTRPSVDPEATEQPSTFTERGGHSSVHFAPWFTRWRKASSQGWSSRDSGPAAWPAALRSCTSPRWVYQSEPRTSARGLWSSCTNSPGTPETCRDQTYETEVLSGVKTQQQAAFKDPLQTNHLGFLASAIHSRSMLQARTGMWGYRWELQSLSGFPLVSSTSTISWRLVSHLIGSPNKMTAVGANECWVNPTRVSGVRIAP